MCTVPLPPGVNPVCTVPLPPGVNPVCTVPLPPGVNPVCTVLLPPGVNPMCTVLLPPGVIPMCTVLLPPGVNPIAVNTKSPLVGRNHWWCWIYAKPQRYLTNLHGVSPQETVRWSSACAGYIAFAFLNRVNDVCTTRVGSYVGPYCAWSRVVC
jgi:hypothetical protein